MATAWRKPDRAEYTTRATFFPAGITVIEYLTNLAPRASTRQTSSLDMPRYFHIIQIMKTIARLPLAQLEASAQHVEAFKALSHLTRLQVFFFLVRAQGEVSVGEIQQAVEVPGPTLSHHLDQLRRAGLIESRKEERYIYYSVRPETVTALVRVLTACC